MSQVLILVFRKNHRAIYPSQRNCCIGRKKIIKIIDNVVNWEKDLRTLLKTYTPRFQFQHRTTTKMRDERIVKERRLQNDDVQQKI